MRDFDPAEGCDVEESQIAAQSKEISLMIFFSFAIWAFGANVWEKKRRS